MKTDVNKVFVFDKMSWNNWKDWRYAVGYQTDEKVTPIVYQNT